MRLAERAADSRVQFLTPGRPSCTAASSRRDYLTDRAPRDPNSCCTESDDYITQGLRGPAPYLYVSPMAIRPRVGTLTQITSAQLDSPSAAPGIPYQYYVAYQAQGRIPAQRFVVRPADLATERAGFYAATPSRGYLSNFESFPIQDGLLHRRAVARAVPAPGDDVPVGGPRPVLGHHVHPVGPGAELHRRARRPAAGIPAWPAAHRRLGRLPAASRGRPSGWPARPGRRRRRPPARATCWAWP